MGKLRNITEFQAKLANGGARSNLFEVQIPTLPSFIEDEINDALEADDPDADEFKWSGGLRNSFKFLCKAAQFPASNIGTVEIPFRGKVLKVGGDRVVDPWTVTIINDENNAIRTIMEIWMEGINANPTAEGRSNIDGQDENNIFTDAYIFQLGRKGDSTKDKPLPVYKFFDIWPSNISEIALSYDSTDTVEEFTVEFQVHRWTEASGNKIDKTIIDEDADDGDTTEVYDLLDVS